MLDGAVAVFCGVAGVQPQSETVWRQANRYEVPRIVFINKMDRMGANFDAVVSELHAKLRANAWPVLVPWGSEDALLGQIDIINKKALRFVQGRTGGYAIEDVPSEWAERAAAVRAELVLPPCGCG